MSIVTGRISSDEKELAKRKNIAYHNFALMMATLNPAADIITALQEAAKKPADNPTRQFLNFFIHGNNNN